jgi:polyhydroxybutyrate depolymerase
MSSLPRAVIAACAVAACSTGAAPAPRAPAPAPAPKPFRLALCAEAPIRLQSAPGVPQSRGCVATFTQELSDPATIRWVGANQARRRYLVYAPANLPAKPVPVVFVFPGYSASAEGAAFYYTHGSFERLADRDGFIVVYGNGLPNALPPGEKPAMPAGGFLKGCLADHGAEGVDVTYVRLILDQLSTELRIDRSRVYATGLSAGGGMAFQLALEAPDLVAAIAPVAGLPFQPSGPWLHHCHPRPGYERVSIAMLAATHDRFISYAPGGSPEYPAAAYPGMEQTRDAWLAALQIRGAPVVDRFPDLVQGDSHTPHTGLTTSTIERFRYPPGPAGQELWFYKAEGMGHWWPHPTPMWPGLWERFGKANQDIDFAEEVWAFFKRHPAQASSASRSLRVRPAALEASPRAASINARFASCNARIRSSTVAAATSR